MTLKIASLNVRGLGEAAKRRDIFHYFNIKPFQVILLQELHCTKKTEYLWKAEWGHNMILAHGSSVSKGVGILIKNNCSYTIHRSVIDPKGRYVILDLTLLECRLTLVNLYGPNVDNPEFFKEIIKILDEMPNLYRIIGGDFNLVLDNKMDKKGGNPVHQNKLSQEVILSWIRERGLVDIWRQNNPSQERFTWTRRKPTPILCRLDFFLIDETMTSNVMKADISFGVKTDHSMISLEIKTTENKRGPGFWKFNCSLLQDDNYIKLIKETIQETITDNPNTEPPLLWDTVKCKVRGVSINYSSRKAKANNKEFHELEQKINDLVTELESHADKKSELEEKLNNLRQIFTEKLEFRTQGAIFRCKSRYAEFGEKNTAYFLNLEKRNSAKKVISKLKLENGGITEDSNIILSQLENYYTKLYTSVETSKETQILDAFFNGLEGLSKVNSDKCEGQILEDELFSCLNTLPNQKSPGTDGLPAEWYKCFWSDIKSLLLNSVNHSYITETLSITQRQGIITVIPKRDKDLLLVKNWRPISLLNVDYKLIAKCIATRIKTVLPSIIHEDQSGFLKNRYIGENLIRTVNLIEYSQRNNLNTFLTTIDFEKAFDFLEKNYIAYCLKFFKFGPNIIK